jgi:hypothetical protein
MQFDLVCSAQADNDAFGPETGQGFVGQGTALEMQVTDVELALEVLAGLDFLKGVNRDSVRLIVETSGERAADVSRALAQ